jgi:hypothetical protein
MPISLKYTIRCIAVVPACHDQPLGHQLGSAAVRAFEAGLLGTTIILGFDFSHQRRTV